MDEFWNIQLNATGDDHHAEVRTHRGGDALCFYPFICLFDCLLASLLFIINVVVVVVASSCLR